MKSFEEAWAEREARGYQYGEEALSHVEMGWEMGMGVANERIQELLATIARISQSTPLDSEVAEALEQRGKLLAEIGTLRADLATSQRFLTAEQEQCSRIGTVNREAIQLLGGRYPAGLIDTASTVVGERDAYRSMLCDLLASARFSYSEDPAMFPLWQRARRLLKHGPAKEPCGGCAKADRSKDGHSCLLHDVFTSAATEERHG